MRAPCWSSPGMTEAHFDRLAAAGVKWVKFLFYPFKDDTTEARNYVKWSRARGMRVKVHTGGVSRSGASVVCGYNILSWLQPDIAAHVSGGPIPMSDEDIDPWSTTPRSRWRCARRRNYRSTARLVARLIARNQLHRLTLGTDTPGGTGVIPRGMLRNVLYFASMCNLTPGQAVAVATGNTARAHGVDVGFLEVGRPADIVVCGSITGSAGTTLERRHRAWRPAGHHACPDRRRIRRHRPQPADPAADQAGVLLLLQHRPVRSARRLGRLPISTGFKFKRKDIE